MRLPLLLLVCVRMTLLGESRLQRVYDALVDGDVVADSKVVTWRCKRFEGGWARRLRCQNSERRGRSNHYLRQRKLTMPYSLPARAGIAGCNQTRAKIRAIMIGYFFGCSKPLHRQLGSEFVDGAFEKPNIHVHESMAQQSFRVKFGIPKLFAGSFAVHICSAGHQSGHRWNRSQSLSTSAYLPLKAK